MYDLIIIGTGPGGYEAILTALRKNLNIAVVEKDKLGGNCLNRACIPTKYLRSGAYQIEKLSKLKEYGIDVKDFSLDYTKAFESKNSSISFLRNSLAQLLKSKKVPVYKGIGKIVDKNKVQIVKEDSTTEIIEGKNIIIATGSIPASVGNLVPDGNYIITTEDYMERLSTLPKSMLVIGGGVAGCEIGYIAKIYGCDVYLTELQDRLLPSNIISQEISKYLLRKFKSIGIKTYFQTTVESYQIKDNSIDIKLSNGEVINVEKILLTVGRKPNTLDIDTIGIEKDSKGFIKVNEYLQTNYENIYAIGDVINSPMLAHVAGYEAKIALHNITSQEKESPNYDLVPWAIFSAYEIGHIGLNEELAKGKGIELISGYYTYRFNEKAVDELEPDGYVRLYFEKDSKIIVGADVVGSGASELIHTISTFIKEKYTAKQVHDFIYFHPSLTEILAYASYDVAIGKLF